MFQSWLDPSALDEVHGQTKWTPKRCNVRRSTKTQKQQRTYLCKLYLDEFYMKDMSMWAGFVKKHILKQTIPSGQTRALCPNKFPYKVKNSTHYILWCTDDHIYDTLKNVTDYLKTQLPQRDFAWYKNPKPSMPHAGIHYHVFVKK